MSKIRQVVVLDCGTYISCPANAQHPFAIDVGTVVMPLGFDLALGADLETMSSLLLWRHKKRICGKCPYFALFSLNSFSKQSKYDILSKKFVDVCQAFPCTARKAHGDDYNEKTSPCN